MNKFLEKAFKLEARGTSFKNEVLAGLITFIAMCYILPLNSTILGDMGMNGSGVFAATALVSALCCILMGSIANVPLALSAGMGLNAFLVYTVSGSIGFSWQESMILLLVSGIVFFVLSVTPVRKILMAKFPKSVKLIISAGLGAFICFVGLNNGGIIQQGSGTPVTLGDFSNPAVLIAIIGVVLVLGLMFSKVKFLSKFAIPLVLLVSAVASTVLSTVLINTGSSSLESVIAMGLPTAPWDNPANNAWGMSGIQDVLFFGFISKSPQYAVDKTFGEMLVNIFTNPAAYIAIFSLTFVNLFDTTATMLTLSNKIGIVDHETGEIQGVHKMVLADAVGSVVCAPLGTSTVTTFAESSVGVEMGARTGLSAITTGTMFLLAAFIYPVFSFFSAGCVTAPALVAVGALIFVENFKEIEWKDPIVPITGFITVVMMLLTYSLADGLGIGLICYVIMMLFAGRYKELNVVLYVLCGLFLVAFTMNAIMPYITPNTESVVKLI